MIKKKSIICLLILFVLTACEYKPIYSKKNVEFSIAKIEIKEKNKINFKIRNGLKNNQNEDSLRKYDLMIDGQKIISIASKDKKGNPKTFIMEISVSTITKVDKSLNLEKRFTENFSYNNDNNKFNLKQYEKIIQNNLINKITENITSYLSSL